MIYFDNAASTKPDDLVISDFLNKAKECYANPSSIHQLGMEYNFSIERIKTDILNSLKLDNSFDVIFTSGATESNNLAILGYALKNKNKGNHLITSKYEHDSVLNVFKYLETKGFNVTYLDILSNGEIDYNQLKSSINDQTILISIMCVNNELGSVNNLLKISEIINKYPKSFFHSDFAQTLGKEKVDFSLCDMITLSSHKIYGLKGIGCLIKKKKINIDPIILGGGQQNNLRSGTLDFPLISSLNVCIKECVKELDVNYLKVKNVHDYIFDNLEKIDGIKINSKKDWNPYILSFSLINKKASVVVEALSLNNIYVSSTSACNSKSKGASHVLLAFLNDENLAKNSIRLSFSKNNTIEEAKIFIQTLKEILNNIKG